MKFIPYILILILVGVIAFLILKPKDDSEIVRLSGKLDSLSVLINKDKVTIQKLLKDAETNEIKELEYLKEADSLALIISNLHVEDDCPEIVENQSKEIVVLRTGLKECNKSKGIYKVTLGICQDIVVKYEVKEITNNELTGALMKETKKSKQNAFLLGSGSTLVVVLAILLLL